MVRPAPQPPGKFSLLGLLAGDQYEAGLSRIAADKYGQPQARGLAVPHSRMVRDLGVNSSSAGDNIVGNTKPKHLNTGKRGIGKTDWR